MKYDEGFNQKCLNQGVNIFSLLYYIEYMFCNFLTNQKFNSSSSHGNQGVNPCIMAVFEMYWRHKA